MGSTMACETTVVNRTRLGRIFNSSRREAVAGVGTMAAKPHFVNWLNSQLRCKRKNNHFLNWD